MTRRCLIAAPAIALMAVLVFGPGGALADPATQLHYGLDNSMRPDIYGAPGFQTQTPNEWGRPGGGPSDAVPYSRIFPERSGFGSSRDPARDAQGQSYILPGSQTNLGYY